MTRSRSRSADELLFVGIKRSVVALSKADGSVAWIAQLPRMSSLVTVVREGGLVYAASGGEVSALDALTGRLLWHNELKGYGRGFVTFAGVSGVEASAAAIAAQQAAMAGAVAASTAASASAG